VDLKKSWKLGGESCLISTKQGIKGKKEGKRRNISQKKKEKKGLC